MTLIRVWVLGLGFRVLGVLGLGFKSMRRVFSGFYFEVLGCRFEGFRVCGLGVSGFWVWVWGF